MQFVARINAFWTVADFPIYSAFQSALFFNDRDTDIFGYTGINCGLIDDDAAGHKISTNNMACILNRFQVRSFVLPNGRRYCHN